MYSFYEPIRAQLGKTIEKRLFRGWRSREASCRLGGAWRGYWEVPQSSGFGEKKEQRHPRGSGIWVQEASRKNGWTRQKVLRNDREWAGIHRDRCRGGGSQEPGRAESPKKERMYLHSSPNPNIQPSRALTSGKLLIRWLWGETENLFPNTLETVEGNICFSYFKILLLNKDNSETGTIFSSWISESIPCGKLSRTMHFFNPKSLWKY